MSSPDVAVPADNRLPPELIRIASVAGFGSLLLNLSSTTLNVALDRLTTNLGTTLGTAQWTITGYLLALTIVMPLFRWTVERVGIRRLYLMSLLGFTVASALCGLAWSVQSLVAFRLLQGAVGGLLTPVAQALLAQWGGARYMGRMLSIGAMPVLIAPLLGPVVGGLLVQRFSWRAIFFMNVPFGLLCAWLCTRYLPVDDHPSARRSREDLDVLGLALLSPGMALVIYGVTTLRKGAEHSLLSAALPFAAAIVLLTLFVLHARRQPDRALIDLRLFRDRTIVAALFTYILASIASFGGAFLLPLYFQQVRGQSPGWTGALVALQGVGMLLTLPQIGKLTDRYDPGLISMCGVLLTLAGTAAFLWSAHEVALALLGLSLVVRGAGLGAVNSPALSTVYRRVPRNEIANATAALNIVQRMGAPLGTALVAMTLQWRLTVETTKAHAFSLTFAVCALASLLTLIPIVFLTGAPPPSPEPRSTP